ncbi:MAG: ABC transporter ATP-binding protein [Lachnospiraceae bacterium]|nr:ABC transporter ATP-binding protein [Lachnospiraceae bacterium]
MIRFDNVSFAYSANSKANSLNNITLHIEKGECVLLAGASGCGKSTLLRLLNGLIPEFYEGKRTGRIFIEGRAVEGRGIYDMVGKIGTVFQNPRSQFFNVDTTSELAFGCENLALPEKQILERIDSTVKSFDIEKLMGRSIFELSGGEKQKIACASVDVLEPDVILLDEPSANMDYDGMINLRQVIKVWKKHGKTVLIAEHRMNFVWDIADRVILLEQGRIKEELNREQMDNFTEADCRKYSLRGLRQIKPEEVELGNNNILIYKTGNEENADTNAALGKENVTDQKSNDNIILLCDFSYAYKGEKELFHISSMDISENKVTAIIGTNGAGKTTFLECLCGIRRCRGTMKWHGKGYKGKQRIKQVFMVMQDPNHQLFAESVLDEVLISMKDEDEERAKDILAEMDLLEFADRHPMSLSGGQKQRVAIACAIASECPILLLDEPTSGLDYRHMLEVSDILTRLKASGKTIITVTHDTEFIEQCCDEIRSLDNLAG